ncbi:arsenate reductase ArsC [Futiania mangrovi]|uniref:Arsenate reductase ArsC n=1 Tax=Futiania mangrovi TaxID=2959716 RepID=A0A9J6PHF4_9PROT|nr:arsenate reductase ArsC [Futiania mangrovii]MCP1337942.1 arsenate reductase ArsC [Futiania mangrovii]
MKGPHGEDLPGAVLFACSQNAIRSPMAEAIMKHLYGRVVFVDSCGVRTTDPDPFMVATMDEIGIDLSSHVPKTFDDLEDTNYDLVISLSPEAQHKAVDLTRTMAVEIEYWPTMDPSLASGNREQRMEAYRQVRDALFEKIRARFGAKALPRV